MELTDHSPEVHPLIGFEQDVANRMFVRADTELTHPFVLKSERLLKRAKRGVHGLIASPTGALQGSTRVALYTSGRCGSCSTLLTAFEKPLIYSLPGDPA